MGGPTTKRIPTEGCWGKDVFKMLKELTMGSEYPSGHELLPLGPHVGVNLSSSTQGLLSEPCYIYIKHPGLFTAMVSFKSEAVIEKLYSRPSIFTKNNNNKINHKPKYVKKRFFFFFFTNKLRNKEAGNISSGLTIIFSLVKIIRC